MSVVKLPEKDSSVSDNVWENFKESNSIVVSSRGKHLRIVFAGLIEALFGKLSIIRKVLRLGSNCRIWGAP